jgi:predicted nucleic acid-binding protein
MAPADQGKKLAALRTWLVDTGPLVAYLGRREQDHERVRRAFGSFSGRMFSTTAVITEAMHFLTKFPAGPNSLANLVTRSGILVLDACQPSEIRKAARLMNRYRDARMDFADATLILIADLLDVTDILTLDRRGFSTFRTSDGKPFNLVMDAA